MHLTPQRQTRPIGDVIFTLNAEATRRKSQGEAIINATIGALLEDDGRLAVLETAAHTVREVKAAEWAAYAPIPGTPELNQAVIDDTFRGMPAFSRCATAVATPGGTGALRHALMCYLESGQKLLTTSFYWGPYQTLCDEHERGIDTFSMFTAQGGLDVNALDAKVAAHLQSQGRVLLFINDPCQNPTGYSMTSREWQDVVDCLVKHAERGPVTLLIDMAYFLYARAGDPRAFIKQLEPLLGRVGLLFAWSASKSFTHYGLRVGALVACVPDPEERTQTQAALAFACRGTWSNCVRGGLSAITRLLTEDDKRQACDTERERLKAMLRARVDRFNQLAGGKGLVYPRYEGGFFVTVFTEAWKEKGQQMKEQGVFVVPQPGALRVALCSVSAEEIPRLVDALAS